MQSMHKSTHDRPLTGVHWPIHRCRCMGSGTKGDLSTSTGGARRGAGRGTKTAVYIPARCLGSVIDRSVCPGAGFQKDYSDGPLQRNNVDTTLIKRFYSINRSCNKMRKILKLIMIPYTFIIK